MAARATVRKTGSKSTTATRVAGSEPLKISTPTKPLIQPLVILSIVMLLCSRPRIGSGPMASPETMQYSFDKTVMEHRAVQMDDA